jgi:cysteinyl-tRNA synthetase
MKTKTEKTKEERIKEEIKRLNGIFSKMSKNTKRVVKSLIENAAFMAITLEDLQNDINIKGVISEYQNGENQWGTKKSPEVEVYNSMTKNHTQIMKQLADLIPKEQPKQEGDGFEDFCETK